MADGSGNDANDPENSPASTAPGEAILAMALAEARRAWGARLVAAYALGSIAHGGFSVHVSDVDLGLVIADPLDEGDVGRVEALAGRTQGGRGSSKRRTLAKCSRE